MGPTNVDRAAWAQEAVDAFLAVCSTDDCDVIGDMICDLLHLAHSDPARYGNAIRQHRNGLSNFEAELEEEDDECAPCEGYDVPDDGDGERSFNSNGVCTGCGVKDKRG